MRVFPQSARPGAAAVMSRVPTSAGRGRSGHSAAVSSILDLQRTVGNQAVQRMIGLDARGGAGGDGDIEDQRALWATVQRDDDPATLTADPTTAGPSAAGATDARRATPVDVRNGPSHAPINNGDRVGMSIAITISSSTGNDADMAAIQDSEQVSLSANHTGSMVGVAPTPSNTSGFMAGFPIPDDQHSFSKATIIDRADNHGGDGSFEKQQLDIFTDAAGGVTAPTAIPASGYIIKRSWVVSGTKITLTTEKHGAAASVNGFTSTAGPSASQSEDVVVRDAVPQGPGDFPEPDPNAPNQVA